MQICGGFVAVVVLPSLVPSEEHIVLDKMIYLTQLSFT